MRVVDDYVFLTGQNRPLQVYKLVQPTDTSQPVGSLNVLYPAGWYHPHSELVVQPSGDETFAVYLQIGSDKNFGDTVQTVRIQNGTGGTIAMAGDSIQRLSLSVANDALNVLNVTQIATGLRNAAGMAFEPTTGDLYIAENGMDGLVNANEPTSADELNVVAASHLGSEIVDFGFPQVYVEDLALETSLAPTNPAWIR